MTKDTALSQERAPIYEALEQFKKMRVVPFDVPGHKRGRGNPELTAFLGEKCVGADVNSMKPLDNLCHPVSVIREAEIPRRPGLWGGKCFFHGERHDLSRPGDDPDGLQKGRQDHPAAQRAQERHQRAGALRGGAGLCEPRDRQPSGHRPRNHNRPGGEGHSRKSGSESRPGQQSHILRYLFRPRRHCRAGPRTRSSRSGGRGPRHAFFIFSAPARLRHGRRSRYGGRQHAQVGRQPDPEQFFAAGGLRPTPVTPVRSST